MASQLHDGANVLALVALAFAAGAYLLWAWQARRARLDRAETDRQFAKVWQALGERVTLPAPSPVVGLLPRVVEAPRPAEAATVGRLPAPPRVPRDVPSVIGPEDRVGATAAYASPGAARRGFGGVGPEGRVGP